MLLQIPHLQTNEKIVNAPEIQTLQCTEYDASAARALMDGPVVKMDTVPSRHVSFAETVEKVEFDPAMAYPAPETMMTLPATTPLVHAADMTSSATTPQIQAADMEESGLYSDDIKLVMLHGKCSRSEAVSALRANNNDLIEAILCFEKEETVMQAVNRDIIETSEKRTLRISPVADTPESQTLECTEGLDTAPDLEKDLCKANPEHSSG